MFIRWNPLDRAHTTHTADDYRFDAVCGLDLKDQSNVTPQKRLAVIFFADDNQKRKRKLEIIE